MLWYAIVSSYPCPDFFIVVFNTPFGMKQLLAEHNTCPKIHENLMGLDFKSMEIKIDAGRIS